MLKIEKQAKAIKITEVKESNYKGQFIVEPLYRGYGILWEMHLEEFYFHLYLVQQ